MRRESGKNVYRAIRRGFWYGVAYVAGWEILLRGWMGTETYTEFVCETSTNVHWSIGLLIAAVAIYLNVGMVMRFKWLAGEQK